MKKISLIKRMLKMRKTVSRSPIICDLLPVLLLFIFPISSYGANQFAVTDTTGDITFVVTDVGNVGIATTAPANHLSVVDQSTTATRGLVVSQATSDTASAALILRKSRGTDATPLAIANGDYVGATTFRTYDGSAYNRNAFIGAKVNGPVTIGSVPTDLFFATSVTDESDPYAHGKVRMVISALGNIGIGTTTPAYPLQMGSGAYVSAGGVWTNASSREYKDNIKDLSTEEAVETLRGLNPVKYNYKTDKEDQHVGFIAEDVPDLVATKDRKGLSPMDMVAVVTKVVQEQQRTIEEQQKTISALSEKVADLQREVKLKGSMASAK